MPLALQITNIAGNVMVSLFRSNLVYDLLEQNIMLELPVVVRGLRMGLGCFVLENLLLFNFPRFRIKFECCVIFFYVIQV